MTYLNSYFRLIKARDRELARHAERVRAVTEILATDGLQYLLEEGHVSKERLFSDEALQGIVQGALLHELGKVTLEDAVLYPEKQLSDEQTFKLRSYPQIGYEILAELPISRPEVLKIVLHHHEKWDGSGYPLGLTECSIPLEAQIVSIADYFVHIAEPRSGFGADPSRGLTWIKKLANEHFNPILVEAFEALFEDIRDSAFPDWIRGEESVELQSPLFPSDLHSILEENLVPQHSFSIRESQEISAPADVLFRQAKLEAEGGQLDEALATLRSAISLDPQRMEIRDLFLEVALTRGAYRLHLEQQLECVKLFLSQGKTLEAKWRCEKIVQLEYTLQESPLPNKELQAFQNDYRELSPEIAFLKGTTYEALGEYDMASLYFGQSRELAPGDWRFNLALGRNYFHLGVDTRALELLESIPELAPDEAAPAFEVIGEIMHRNESGHPAVYFRKAAQLYEKKKQTDDAQRVRQRLREL